jgi:hypothetical protein
MVDDGRRFLGGSSEEESQCESLGASLGRGGASGRTCLGGGGPEWELDVRFRRAAMVAPAGLFLRAQAGVGAGLYRRAARRRANWESGCLGRVARGWTAWPVAGCRWRGKQRRSGGAWRAWKLPGRSGFSKTGGARVVWVGAYGAARRQGTGR